MQVTPIPCLKDNYAYGLTADGYNEATVIDPSEARPVLRWLSQHGLRLAQIVNTHHHWDHVGGNLELIQATGCSVLGPALEADRVPGITRKLQAGDSVQFAGVDFEVLAAPGHTDGHLLLYSQHEGVLFAGDVLFAMGCGRLFEGTPEQMVDTLNRIRSLPLQTKIYCGHEYALRNGEFALTLEPKNHALQARVKRIRGAIGKGSEAPLQVPLLLEEEIATNPFLRLEEVGIAASIPPHAVQIFTQIRDLRNRW